MNVDLFELHYSVLFLFFMMFKWSSMLSSASRLNATCLYLVIRVASGAGMRDYLQVPPNCRMKIDHRTCTTDGRICPHIHNWRTIFQNIHSSHYIYILLPRLEVSIHEFNPLTLLHWAPVRCAALSLGVMRLQTSTTWSCCPFSS